MKRKSLIEAVSPQARDFIEAGTPKPQFMQIERWSGLITDNKPALVALLDRLGMKRGTVASTLDYLRKVADRKGISFYTHTIFWSVNKLERIRLCLHGLTVRKRTKWLIFRRPAP